MEFNQLEDFMKEKRSTSCGYHARLGRKWRMFGEPEKLHAPLAYAAFEFRIAMESCLLGLLFIVQNRPLTETEKKYDFGQLKKALYKTQSKGKDGKEKLQRSLEFNSLYAKLLPYPYTKRIAIVDIEKINKFWNKLSSYCHHQLDPKDTWGDITWITKGYDLLNEVENYVWQVMVNSQVGWANPQSLPKEIIEVAKDFVERKIDKQSLEIRLRLILPVLELKALKYSQIITF